MRQESNQQQTAVNRFCVSSILGKQRKQLLQADERKDTVFNFYIALISLQIYIPYI